MAFVVDRLRSGAEFVVEFVGHYCFYLVDEVLPVGVYLLLVEQVAALLGLLVVLGLHP